MNNVLIRRCADNDIDDVRRMQMQWAEEDITYGFVPSCREDLTNRLGSYFFVAEVDGCLVGFIYGSLRVSEGLAVLPAGQQYLQIDDIYVKPEFRDKGIGGRLLESLFQTAQHNGISRFLVYSATKDLDKILKFYRSHGFESWYVQMFK